jgi:hypothetical protein
MEEGTHMQIRFLEQMLSPNALERRCICHLTLCLPAGRRSEAVRLSNSAIPIYGRSVRTRYESATTARIQRNGTVQCAKCVMRLLLAAAEGRTRHASMPNYDMWPISGIEYFFRRMEKSNCAADEQRARINLVVGRTERGRSGGRRTLCAPTQICTNKSANQSLISTGVGLSPLTRAPLCSISMVTFLLTSF